MYQINLAGIQTFIARTLADVLVLLNDGSLPHEDVSVFRNGLPLKIVLNGYGKYGIMQDGNVEEIFTAMLTEVDMYYIRPHGTVRQPFEMLPDEWKAFTSLGSAVFNSIPCFSEEQRRHQCLFINPNDEEKYGTIEYFSMRTMMQRFGYDHNGPLYGADRQSNGRHEVHVAYALAEGKAIPFAVLQWYQSHPAKVQSIGEWFALALERPEYRGSMSVDKLSALANLLKWEKIELTNENSPQFILLMADLPDDATITQVDDFLYEKGMLKVRETTMSVAPCDLTQAYSPFAFVLRAMLGETRKQDAIALAHEQRNKFHHSLRNLHERMKEADLLPELESFHYANKIAEAIDKKDVGVLLACLDTSQEHNQTTKKAVYDTFGFKVNGLKSADRRTAVFVFCGYDSEQRIQYEKSVADKAADAQRKREITDVTETAENAKVSWNGVVMSAKTYVDQMVECGFTVIAKTKKGAATLYWLYDAQLKSGRSIRKADGSLDYAKSLPGVTEHRQAA